MKAALYRLWQGWKRVGRAIGDVIARVILTILYFTIVLPFGLISTLARDPLHVRSPTPGWLERERPPATLDEAGRLS